MLRYPILLVHGVAARDGRHAFGRIPAALRDLGIPVLFGGHDAWGTFEDNAALLQKTIEKSGYDKVNIVAHSKGGLDARYLISVLDKGRRVASLTTVATPHGGSYAMERMLRFPTWRATAALMTAGARLSGDRHPHVYTVSRALTPAGLAAFNRQCPDVPGVFYQSYGAVMSKARRDPAYALLYRFVRRAEGANDGVVSALSARWTNFHALTLDVSHGDLADGHHYRPRRDVRPLYLDIVKALEAQGL
ncbi:MAG: hypothetical protein FWF49_06095 [Oscillospiraceae bacterium]|nr:hypothetical protein [Oscillospiraceae bacterium]